MIHPQSAVVLLSGGMDSTALLAKMNREFGPKNVQPVAFFYGQRHQRELAYAFRVARFYDQTLLTISVDSSYDPIIRASKSSLLRQSEIPHGLYDEENMKSTVVPGRNLLMASYAAAYAEAAGFDAIALATHAGDHAIYPDCRPGFIQALRQTILASTDQKVTVLAPFILFPKSTIAKTGIENKAPFQLTWSCYEGGQDPCHKCGTCVERLEAFTVNRVKDPAPLGDRQAIIDSLFLLKVNEKISEADLEWGLGTY